MTNHVVLTPEAARVTAERLRDLEQLTEDLERDNEALRLQVRQMRTTLARHGLQVGA